MRKLLFLVVAAGLAAATAVGLAAATPTAKTNAKASVPSESNPNAYLPTGVAPCTDNWLAAGCDIANTAFSQLTQITPSNVSKLHMIWQDSLDGPTFRGYVEDQPICCANNMMYQATITGLDALNPQTGAIVWSYQGPAANTARTDSATPVQATVARDESYDPVANLVFEGQQDGSLVALNAMTGAPVWTTQISATGTYGSATHSETMPMTQYYNNGKDGLVFSAPNGGESPIRGHLDAYDAKTGALVWRFWTTPDPTQLPYILTWANPAEAALAGATVWSIPSIDPNLGDIYFGTGNPYPYTGRQPGKDLWSDSLMAVNINTGAMRWYFQTTHHDEWDYDCPTPTVVFNTPINGKMTPVIAGACKEGYIFELNRANGHPIFPIPEVPVPDLNGGLGQLLNNTWPTEPEPQGGASQILIHCPTNTQAQQAIPGFPTAPNGTPIVPTCPFAPSYSNEYVLWGPFYATGGTDYPRMSFDPQTNDLYVCANISMQATENVSSSDYHQSYISSGLIDAAGPSGTVSALNMDTNKMTWQNTFQATTQGGCYSGLLTTASNLAFVASKTVSSASAATLAAQGLPYGGTLYAYNATTGAQLWSWQNVAVIQAPPITYMYKGTQYVAEDMGGPQTTGATAATVDKGDLLTVFAL